MSQRFTVTAFSKSDGERAGADIQGEVNQLFEGDEPTPSSTDKGGACSLTEDALKGRMDAWVDGRMNGCMQACVWN